MIQPFQDKYNHPTEIVNHFLLHDIFYCLPYEFSLQPSCSFDQNSTQGTMSSSIEKNFFRGNHTDILDQFYDTMDVELDASLAVWVIGSLAFLGRMKEADTLLKVHSPQMESIQSCASWFFLITGHLRNNHPEDAKFYLCQFKTVKQTTALQKFYWYQSLGFYHFMSGYFRLAEKYAEKAYLQAVAVGFFYGRAISLDLQGHSLVVMGEVHRGIESITRAKKYFNQLNNSQNAGVINRAINNYRERYFVIEPEEDSEDPIGELDQNNFSQSFALLTKTRLQCLRGRVKLARNTLTSVQKVVDIRHPGYERSLRFRKAYIEWCEGQYLKALETIASLSSHLSQLDPQLQSQIIGLECKIKKSLGQPIASDRIKRLETLARQTSFIISKRIAKRSFGVSFEIYHGRDPLGDWIDRIHDKHLTKEEKVCLAIDSGYLGFLYDILEIPRHLRSICLNPVPGILIFFDKGDVRFHRFHSTNQLVLKLFQAFGKSKRLSKQQVIEELWGYNYNPLKHDALIYDLIARARALLKSEGSDWISPDDDGYRLDHEWHIVEFLVKIKERDPLPEASPGNSMLTNLNQRQLKFIRYLEKHNQINAKTCLELFEGVTRITVSRDLASLCEMGILDRRGRGKSTFYILNNTPKS